MRAIVVGAGIGGLATALMLHARGIRAVVVEQSPEVREVGVGINTLPHAIRELAELGLLPALDAVGIRTRELVYYNRQGQEVWRELRGTEAGHAVPQFSIHRGRLQKVIHDAVIDRLGPDAVRTGLALAGFLQDEGGVTAHFTDAVKGDAGLTLRGDVLICADGIHSAARRRFYPDEGAPCWNGVLMWRGAAPWPVWGDGRTMAIGGGMGAKFVLYPIAPIDERHQLVNWVVNIKTADAGSAAAEGELVAPGPARPGAAPCPALRRAGLRHHGSGRGDDPDLRVPDVRPRSAAALDLRPRHPARRRRPSDVPGRIQWCLAGDPRRPRPRRRAPAGRAPGAGAVGIRARAPAEDRRGGAAQPRRRPERVIDEAEKRAPGGFARIEDVLSFAERQAIVGGYAGTAGFAPRALRAVAG